MRPTVPSGDGYDLCRGFPVAVVAPIDMHTGALERRHAGRTAPALRRGRGPEAGACGPAIAIAALQGPTEGVIVEWPGSHAGRHQAGGGCVLEAARHAVARVGDAPQAMAPQRVDRVTHGEVPQCRRWWGGVGDPIAHAECVAPARHKAAVVQDWAPGRGVIGQHPLLCG